MRKYYTLLTRVDDGLWYPQFGDYVRSVVQDERNAYRNQYAARDLKIVVTHDDSQAAIDAMIADCNNS